MIEHIENYNNLLNRPHDRAIKSRIPITISVELESPRAGARLLDLLPYVDVAFVGKEFAKYLGFGDMSELIHNIGRDAK